MNIDTNGLIVLDKPQGLSSFMAVKLVMRAVGAKKAGHMGTLDPLASGVLVIGINKGTKLFDKFLKSDKEYYAEYTFGYETDTLDSEGEVINKNDKLVTLEDIKKVAPKFLGKFLQEAPKYSAKKINGQKACDMARKGLEFETPKKEVELYSLEILVEIKPNTFAVKIQCSSGFYVRSLGRDLAKELNTYATTTRIIRTKCCGYTIDDAQSLEEIKNGNAKIYEIQI